MEAEYHFVTNTRVGLIQGFVLANLHLIRVSRWDQGRLTSYVGNAYSLGLLYIPNVLSQAALVSARNMQKQ